MERLGRKDTRIFLLYLVVDIGLILLSFLPILVTEKVNVTFLRQYVLIYFFWAVITILFLKIFNLYQTHRAVTIPLEVFWVCKAVTFATLITGFIIYLSQAIILSKVIFAINFVLLCTTLAGWRTAKKLMNR